eukprot:8103009-Pyramimonas_sp.AAC.1
MVSAIRSSKFDKIQRGSVMAVLCGATWTRDRAVRLGYQCCPKIWECIQCSELRASLVDPCVLEASKDPNVDLLLFTRGLFRHPGDLRPPPLSDTGWRIRGPHFYGRLVI